MKSLDDVRAELDSAWVRNWRAWLLAEGRWPLERALRPPTQKVARSNWAHFVAWRDAWLESSAHVCTEQRHWPSAGGAQLLPTRVEFSNPEALAAFLGPNRTEDWRRGVARIAVWRDQWPGSVPTGRALQWLTDTSEQDAQHMHRLVSWMLANPGADLYVRQLPIPGVDTKWVQRYGRIASEIAQCTGSAERLNASMFKQDRPKCRIRLLSPDLRALMGGLDDISAPVDSISSLTLPVRCAVIVENLQTFLAFGDLPGVVLIFGKGFSALLLREITWLRDLPVIYWGDIDTAGFEILSAVRSALPQAKSFGMDEATLTAHKSLWVPDPKQRRVALARLTVEEEAVYQSLLDQEINTCGVRLEQERESWCRQWHLMTEAVASTSMPTKVEG